MTKTIVSLEDLYFAFCSNQSVKKKAIVGLILSSGMNAKTISKLTLKDFVIACDSYDENDTNVLNKLLKKNPRKIVPCWHIESEKRITFNTPETTQLIFLYLKETFNNKVYNLDEYLFDKNENNISRNVTSFKKYLMNIKNIDKNYFRPKYLQNTFEQICEEHIINMDKTSKSNLINLFQGKTDEDNPFYIKAMKDSDSVRKYYFDLIPYLTVNLYDFENQYELYYKKILEKQNLDKCEIINTYYDIHLKKDLKLEYPDELLLLEHAYKIGKDKQFINSENCLSKLFKKALVCLKLENNHFFDNYNYNHCYSEPTNIQLLTKDIITSIENLKVTELIGISDEELRRIVMQNVVRSKAYTANLNYDDAGYFIARILFKIIDEENII